MREEEYKNKLTAEQYNVLRKGETEPAGSGKYYKNKKDGMYHCAACGGALFGSEYKFDSGTGWPSFDRAVEGAVEYKEDNSHGMRRVETICKKCGSHLGHVFPDGPRETTGKRYCINSLALDFRKDDGSKE